MNPIAKRTITALTIAALLVCAIIYCPTVALKRVIQIVTVLVVLEFGQLLGKKWRAGETPALRRGGVLASSVTIFFVGLVGAVVLAGAFFMLGRVADLSNARLGANNNLLFLYVLAIVKISDMGGFAFGLGSKKLMGDNHKLCPTISPNKSWEGLGGSVFGSCLISCAFMPITHFGWGFSLVLGVTAALVGTFGDLVESKFKRWIGVKDSSTLKITNGMGGFLDMVDSLLFAPAVLWALITWSSRGFSSPLWG